MAHTVADETTRLERAVRIHESATQSVRVAKEFVEPCQAEMVEAMAAASVNPEGRATRGGWRAGT